MDLTALNMRFAALAIAALIGLSGCRHEAPRGGSREPTFAVRGFVTVDGKPAASLAVECHPVTPNPKVAVHPAALTGEDGKFAVETYEHGDGAPVGEYRLTFVWGEYALMNREYTGDKLKKRYSDPAKSEVKVTVKDKAEDLGEIKLTTK